MFSLRKGVTGAILLSAGAAGLLAIPAGAANSAGPLVKNAAAFPNAKHPVPNDNIVEVSGKYVFDPTTITGYKLTKKAFNHCHLPDVSYTITNTTSITQQIKFSPQHGGSDFGAPVPPGGMTGSCVDALGPSPDELTLASNPSATLGDIIVRK